MNKSKILINKYLPIAILYFFFNGFLLPHGVLYTTLLTPFFIFWLIKYPSIKYIFLFFVIIAPFTIIHFMNGVHMGYFLRSSLLIFSVYIFCLSFYQYLENCSSLQSVFRSILLINAAFVVLALAVLPIPALDPVFWNDNQMSLGNIYFRRLKLLTYEPSYYSLLLTPIAIYYYLKIVSKKVPQPALYFLLVSIPLVLSLSFGVILGLIITFIILIILNFKEIVFTKRRFGYFLAGVGILLILVIAIAVLFPNNLFFQRIQNTLSGKDLSFNGRTTDSFFLSLQIAKEKSLLWGVGPGQVKLIGLNFFKEFYHNNEFTIANIGIPNSLADTLATFGIIGVLLKLFIEVYFYFCTRVYTNYYRQSIFLFIFIYQFTGSYIVNIAEYVLWIIAFKTNIFPDLDKNVQTNFPKPKIVNG